jgi:hypothetical protein
MLKEQIMKYLNFIVVIFIGMNFNVYGDVQITRDSLLSYLMNEKIGEQIGDFNISPSGRWVIGTTYFPTNAYADSVELFLFPYNDISKKVKLITFHASGAHMAVDIGNQISGYNQIHHRTWNVCEDKLLIGLRSTTHNTQVDKMEVFKIDIYSITTNTKENITANTLTRILKTSNFPNPFRLKTAIKYFLPQAKYVAINIYNIKGELVKVLEQTKRNRGENTVIWDGTDNKGQRLSSGKYFYQVISGDLITARKIVLLK